MIWHDPIDGAHLQKVAPSKPESIQAFLDSVYGEAPVGARPAPKVCHNCGARIRIPRGERNFGRANFRNWCTLLCEWHATYKWCLLRDDERDRRV